MSFQDENLFQKILARIIKNLKDVFNVIIVDTSPAYDDVNDILFQKSSKILYVMEPNFTDLDNLKTFLDSTREERFYTNKIVPFVNKQTKTKFEESFDTLYNEIRSKNEGLAELGVKAPYDDAIIECNNNYGFYTINSSKFKQALIFACSQILPIFKVKNISQSMKIIEQRKKMEAKKAKEKQIKEATDKFNKEFTTKEQTIEEIKNPEASLTNSDKVQSNVTDDVKQDENTKIFNIKEYLESDLSSKDIDTFISDLNNCEGIKKTKSGFPMVIKQPKTLNKRVWKAYYKKLSKSVK